jgi:hypothetical protein
MTQANDLARLVPGFDFLQGLMKAGGATVPGIGQWIAPTLEPEELAKRIDELRTVQFWLEQNARLLGTTIQALEVQRMTLSTLKGMNVPLGDLTGALKAVMPAVMPTMTSAPSAPSSSSASSFPAFSPAPSPPAPRRSKSTPGGNAAKTPPVDPMQWWGALTQQFTELASKAMKDSSADMARHLAGAAVKQGVETATKVTTSSIERAMSLPAKAAGAAAHMAANIAAGAATKVSKASNAARASGTAKATPKSPRRKG